jgi:hypothetical protein
MSAYVPRFNSKTASTPTDVPSDAQETRRWGATLKPVVNTSLPAKLAPKLAPVTLAAATAATAAPSGALEPMCIKQKKTANMTSMEDFPSLGGKTASKAPVATKTSFASLSREWAAKAKEDEAKAKEEAEAEARLKQFRAKELEKQAAEAFAVRRIGASMTHVQSRKKVDEEDLKYIEDEAAMVEETYSSDEPVEEVYEDEEDGEYDCDGVWDPRKHRDELY